jgi:hypothetical protein
MDMYSKEAVLTLDDGAEIVFRFHDDRARWIADVQLMAAAPELLEACQAAKAIIGEPGDYDGLAWDEAEHLLQVGIEAAVGGGHGDNVPQMAY